MRFFSHSAFNKRHKIANLVDLIFQNFITRQMVFLFLGMMHCDFEFQLHLFQIVFAFVFFSNRALSLSNGVKNGVDF